MVTSQVNKFDHDAAKQEISIESQDRGDRFSAVRDHPWGQGIVKMGEGGGGCKKLRVTLYTHCIHCRGTSEPHNMVGIPVSSNFPPCLQIHVICSMTSWSLLLFSSLLLLLLSAHNRNNVSSLIPNAKRSSLLPLHMIENTPWGAGLAQHASRRLIAPWTEDPNTH